MNDIMELAKKLGEAIKEDARILELNRAKEAYDNDSGLQNAILEYNTQQTALAEEHRKEAPDADIIAAIRNRSDELYRMISTSSTYLALQAAQTEVNDFMNQVNAEITYAITGERPCTHDCSTCGGCH